MKRIFTAVGVALFATPALAAPPSLVVSSEPHTRIQYVQFGGPTFGSACIATGPCTIYVGGPAVLCVDHQSGVASQTAYIITFAEGTFSEPPTCVWTPSSLGATPTTTTVAIVLSSLAYGNEICTGLNSRQ